MLASGSSPLTRGAPFPAVVLPDQFGLIPAHAGSTACRESRYSPARAHPRSRGEHVDVMEFEEVEVGSSPLTRGAPSGTQRSTVHHRLIPAHAGSTFLMPKTGHSIGAHPRSRGEHESFGRQLVCIDGSSPLTRGARQPRTLAQDGLRLIPAHAGSTGSRMSSSVSCRAHPRSRGEHPPMESTSLPRSGSSPLTRGALR